MTKAICFFCFFCIFCAVICIMPSSLIIPRTPTYSERDADFDALMAAAFLAAAGVWQIAENVKRGKG